MTNARHCLAEAGLAVFPEFVHGVFRVHCQHLNVAAVEAGLAQKLNEHVDVRHAGKRLEMAKNANKGTPQAQADRGNDFSMKGRCKRQHINFWPEAIEADGAITSNFLRFFIGVCDAANNLTDQNRTAFRHCWSKRIACELHQQNARLCLQRAASFRRHLKRLPATSDAVLQHDQIQTELPSSVSDRSECRDRQRSRGNAQRARRLRQRRRDL
jgi:hypothetical protein